MARKVFISVLGSTNYGECQYHIDDYTSAPVRFIQEATIEYLMKREEWNSNDVAYILLTEGEKGSEKVNWQDNGHKDREKQTIKCEGLKTRLDKMNLPFKVKPVTGLPIGDNEAEIWDIFKRIFDCLQEGDKLYIDPTHGFRYFPMLILVLVNYAQFLKKTEVRSITYGNYESRDSNNVAPILDLMQLSALQEWTFAAGQYLESGSVTRLIDLSKNMLTPILKDPSTRNAESMALNKFIKALSSTIDDFQTNRGRSILEATNITPVKQGCENIESTFINPLNPVFEKIKEQFRSFAPSRSVYNGFYAAQWCKENGLYQQAITILQESITTLICEEYSHIGANREVVNKAFKIHHDRIPPEKWRFSSTLTRDEIDRERTIIGQLLDMELLQSLSEPFAEITQVRNDINHSGMVENPMKADKVKSKIDNIVNKVLQTLQSHPVESNAKSVKPRLLINLSNHPSDKWSEAQRNAADQYGEIVDLTFPQIGESADEESVAQEVNNYFKKIVDYTRDHDVTVHLMGEMTFTFALINRLQAMGITCIASATQRIVEEIPGENKKITKFAFARFREYIY